MDGLASFVAGFANEAAACDDGFASCSWVRKAISVSGCARVVVGGLEVCRAWLEARDAEATLGKHRLDAHVDWEGTRTALAMAAAVSQVAALLEGVPHVFVKGPALSQLLYADPTRRACHDVDVLVRPEQVEAAILALAAGGFEAVHDLRLDDPRVRLGSNAFAVRRGPVLVEVHWSLFTRNFLLEEPNVFSSAASVQLLGHSIQVAQGSAALSHLVLHGAGSAFRRLLWLSDILQWTKMWPEDAEHVVVPRRILALTAACLEVLEPGSSPVAWRADSRSVRRWARRIRAGWLEESAFPWRNTTDFAYQAWIRPGKQFRYAWNRVMVPSLDDAIADSSSSAHGSSVLRLVRKLMRTGRNQGPRD